MRPWSSRELLALNSTASCRCPLGIPHYHCCSPALCPVLPGPAAEMFSAPTQSTWEGLEVLTVSLVQSPTDLLRISSLILTITKPRTKLTKLSARHQPRILTDQVANSEACVQSFNGRNQIHLPFSKLARRNQEVCRG